MHRNEELVLKGGCEVRHEGATQHRARKERGNRPIKPSSRERSETQQEDVVTKARH